MASCSSLHDLKARDSPLNHYVDRAAAPRCRFPEVVVIKSSCRRHPLLLQLLRRFESVAVSTLFIYALLACQRRTRRATNSAWPRRPPRGWQLAPIKRAPARWLGSKQVLARSDQQQCRSVSHQPTICPSLVSSSRIRRPTAVDYPMICCLDEVISTFSG